MVQSAARTFFGAQDHVAVVVAGRPLLAVIAAFVGPSGRAGTWHGLDATHILQNCIS